MSQADPSNFPKPIPAKYEGGNYRYGIDCYSQQEIDAWREDLRKRVLTQKRDAQLDSNEEVFCAELLEEWL